MNYAKFGPLIEYL